MAFRPYSGPSTDHHVPRLECPTCRSCEPKRDKKLAHDPLRLARYYQSLIDTGKYESRAALARFLGVSRARVTQVLNRLKVNAICRKTHSTRMP